MAFDVEYDVVVVGGGGSGKSAAYTVATESDLSVCVLEKLAEPMGSSQYAEGTGASESIEQAERKVPDYPGAARGIGLPEGAHFPTHEEHYQRYIDYSHHRANPDVIRSWVWNSQETIEIYRSIGAEYTDVTIYAFDQPLELYTFHRPEGLGAHCQELLWRACENAGVDFFMNTPAKELIIEGDAIVGVVCTDADGNEMKVGAKAVILAGGGFGNNMDKVRKYSWMPWMADNNFQSVPTQNTGEGLDMALQAGGGVRNLGTLMIIGCPDGKTLGSRINGAAYCPNLWVNAHGERRWNEAVGNSFADTGNSIAQTIEGYIWSIFDTDRKQMFVEKGADVGLGDFIPIYEPMPSLDAELQESIDSKDGCVIKADTIEGLAEGMGVDPAVLKATVDRYNEMVAAGKDSDFFKPEKFLHPVAKAPFYAIKERPSILVSDGGIYINGNFQVVDDYYVPVKGGNLYAVGNECSGLYGDTYNLDCPGTANGFAHTSGRLAARHAIKSIQG